MKYKFIPGTNIEIPASDPLPVMGTNNDPKLLARNIKCLRRFSVVHSLNTNSNISNLNATLTVGGAR